jgi:transcriptional regulator with XRE-family HTH domain
MDAKKFGTFIAALRKENNMTQVELAQKLQVTDKAVSKWERGLGFPDINTIEPLADALGVSVLEIMRSERIAETEITQDTASAALTDIFEFVKLQRKAERKSIFKIAGGVAACLFLIFLIDGMGWLGFAMVYFPVICLLSGIALLIYGVWRKKNKLPCLQTFVLAAVMLLIPVGVVVFLFLAGALGLAPVPN